MTPPDRPRLVLLIGAHKTASSHLQQSIMAAEPALRDHSVAPVPPQVMRDHLDPIAHMLRDGAQLPEARQAAQDFLQKQAPGADRVVMMNENILGRTDPKSLLRARRLYPWAPRRLLWVVDLFPDHDIDIGLAIRNLATFLPSCWGENLFHKPYVDFDTYMGGIDPTDLSWARLLRRLRDTASRAQIFVWRYEDYTALMPHLCDRILGDRAAVHVTPLDKVMRLCFSAAAAAHLEAMEAPTNDDIHAARKAHSKADGAAPFRPWSQEQRAALDARYATDLKALSRIENLDLLQAPGTSDA